MARKSDIDIRAEQMFVDGDERRRRGLRTIVAAVCSSGRPTKFKSVLSTVRKRARCEARYLREIVDGMIDEGLLSLPNGQKPMTSPARGTNRFKDLQDQFDEQELTYHVRTV